MVTKFTSKEDAEKSRKWHLVDAAGVTLGRLSSEVAAIIRGKHKPEFTPNTDCGDYVVVVNADKVRLTGNKLSDKVYYKHTSFIGNMKAVAAEDVLKKAPERVIQEAVWGMLPKGVLGQHMKLKLKVYAGAEHPHVAQSPQPYALKYTAAAS